MRCFFLPRSMVLSSLAFLMLVSCTHPSKPKSSGQSAESIVAHSGNSASTSSMPAETHANQRRSTNSAETQPTPNATTANASTGHLLSPEQVAKLTKLPIPIVAPTDLPQGFRVVSANGDSVRYINGEDDTGYAIEYQGEGNICFAIQSAKDGPRGLKQIGQVETALGIVKIYEETYQDNRSLQSFIPVKGNPVMISPVSRLNPATGDYEACQALDRTDYERILRSIELVK